MATVPFSVRWRAVLCLLGGWASVILFLFHLSVTGAIVEQSTIGEWAFQWALLLVVLSLCAIGWPLSRWLWRTQRHHHPFVDAWGCWTTRSQKSVFYLTLVIFTLTLVVVVPSCASVADQYTSPRSQFIFSWVVGWWFLETLWIQGITAVFHLVAGILAGLGHPATTLGGPAR